MGNGGECGAVGDVGQGGGIWRLGFPHNGGCQGNSYFLQTFIYKLLWRNILEEHRADQ